MSYLNSSNSSLPLEIKPEFLAKSVMWGLCFGLGIPGNIAVLVILIRNLKEDRYTVRLMLNLAVSDLLTLIPLPPWIWALLHGWTFGSGVCKLVSYVVYWCLYCSMLSMTLLSVQRYMQVLHSQRWAKLGPRGRWGLLCGTWVLSAVLTLYAPILCRAEMIYDGLLHCVAHYKNDEEKVGTLVFETLITLGFFITLSVFYCLLHRGVYQSPFFRSNKITKLVIRILLAYLICWVPLPIGNILLIIAVDLKSESLLTTATIINKVSLGLTFFSCCVNPFLYAFSFKDLWQTSTNTDEF